MMNKVKNIYHKCISAIKLIIAYIFVKVFCRKLIRKKIWLICEKYPEARDNGYHLFKYIRENHPNIPAYYVITKDSADINKILAYGNIIFANSFKHFVFFLCSFYSISSQPSGAVPEPKSMIVRLYKYTKHDGKKIVFLQHGITYNEISHGFDYNKAHYALFVCSSRLEQEFIEEQYGYPSGIVQNLGLCRFDYLINNTIQKKKQVLIMPTFRQWLKSKNMPNEALEHEKNSFIESEFYLEYANLLNNKLLINHLASKGYKIVFYPHYAMQPYIHCFDNFQSDVITIADRWHYDVQQLLIESACLITDYSSIFFDFAYMKKPEVYYQFDKKRFQMTHYKKGYFDYCKHGFGPVLDNSDQVVSYLINLIDNDCQIEEKYLERINAFFDLRDNHNCERTYKAIMQIGK